MYSGLTKSKESATDVRKFYLIFNLRFPLTDTGIRAANKLITTNDKENKAKC